MAWGQWMIPQPGPEHQLTLERQRRAAMGYSLEQAQAMIIQLCELSLHQDLILRAATRHIAELECREALREQDARVGCELPCHVSALKPGG